MSVQRFFNWLIGIPIAAVAAGFAIANRQWVTLSFDPFSRDAPFAAMDMPLWLLFFCGIFAGLMAGWIAAWIGQGKWRRATREARLELVRVQNENLRLRQERPAREIEETGHAVP
jgi:hypothetical protein